MTENKRVRTPKATPTRKRASEVRDRFIPSRSSLKDFVLSPPDENLRMSSDLMDADAIHAKRVHSLLSPSSDAGSEKGASPFHSLVSGRSKRRTSARDFDSPSSSKPVPRKPKLTLELPGFIDDFYLKLLDWGSKGIVATALGDKAYLWNRYLCPINATQFYSADASTESLVLPIVRRADYISSLAWAPNGSDIAVGLSNGAIGIANAADGTTVYSGHVHTDRLNCIAWRNYNIFACGSYDHTISLCDTRSFSTPILSSHTGQVCGLTWKDNLLASGGDDNKVYVWDIRSQETPLFCFEECQAAIKAMMWYRSKILVCCGGGRDTRMRFYNTESGKLIDSVFTGAQISGLCYNSEYREIATSHGDGSIRIWEDRSQNASSVIDTKQGRLLSMTMSPDSTTVAVAGSSGSLSFWKAFPKRKMRGEKVARRGLHQTIR